MVNDGEPCKIRVFVKFGYLKVSDAEQQWDYEKANLLLQGWYLYNIRVPVWNDIRKKWQDLNERKKETVFGAPSREFLKTRNNLLVKILKREMLL